MVSRRAYLAILACIFLASFALKMYFVTREPLAYNNDAGYYVEHVSEVLAQGHSDAPEPPLAFYFAAAFASFAGVMLGIKIASSLASAAILFPSAAIAGHVSGKREAAILAAFLAAFSPTSMFMMGDLLKNMLGLFFGAWFIYFALRSSEKFEWPHAAAAAGFAILMLGSHLSSGAFILLAAMPFLAVMAALGIMRGERSPETHFCIGAVAAVPGWQMRFAWNAFIPIAVLCAAGAGRFTGERSLFFAAAILLSALALLGFVRSGEAISPIIYENEWDGLLRLHAERPDIAFTGAHGGMKQWIEAAGFAVDDGPGERYLLVCDRSAKAENGWYAGGCGMTAGAESGLMTGIPATARFGRFSVVPAGRFYEAGGGEPG